MAHIKHTLSVRHCSLNTELPKVDPNQTVVHGEQEDTLVDGFLIKRGVSLPPAESPPCDCGALNGRNGQHSSHTALPRKNYDLNNSEACTEFHRGSACAAPAYIPNLDYYMTLIQ